MQFKKGYLVFPDGKQFSGKLYHPSDSPPLSYFGEAAFTTAMTGYQETLSDPSYLGQHIIFSTAHVGNYPPQEHVAQARKSYAASLICRNLTEHEFFSKLGVPILKNVDTRALVRYLTKNPTHYGVITEDPSLLKPEDFSAKRSLASKLELVSQSETLTHRKGDHPLVLINYGCKQAIIENLKQLELPFVSLPYNASAEEILSHKPRMIFLSNGPGDPRDYQEQVEVIKQILKTDLPVRGICLGHQLLSLALGGKIEKLPFGHRGINHPVFSHQDNKVLITSQNHGYEVTSLPSKEAKVSYSSLFDKSIEGIQSEDGRLKSVQFHPEAYPGPREGKIFFEEIQNYLQNSSAKTLQNFYTLPEIKPVSPQSLPSHLKRILVIGSGPIKIGQASEFDYSGTQACKVLKELGVEVILLNSNPATIMTDKELCYKTYIEPITEETIKKILLKDKVQAILSTMGGQTALNLSLELEKSGFLKQHAIELLGANYHTINKTEDRELFSKEVESLGYNTGKRYKTTGIVEACELAKKQIGYPLFIRNDFALGGKGATFIEDEEQLTQFFAQKRPPYSFTLEKSLIGWKEVELEVMVDKERNGVIVCSIENIDPCGVHTGDSITVAPVQTLSDTCYQQIRSMALEIAKHMGVVAGGANVQFAINPTDDSDIIVIEMNPRVSRSSALASKATGYPIAKISALLAVGFTLKEIQNDITKASPVCFEPTQDYVAVKIPYFPFNKFPHSVPKLGPQMRSVGEVLSLGGNFCEAFLKALRSLEQNLEIPSLYQLKNTPYEMSDDYILNRLHEGHELSLLTAYHALKRGISKEKVQEKSRISGWFIEQMQIMAELETRLSHSSLADKELLKEAKQHGFSDKFIAKIINKKEEVVYEARQEHKLFPTFKAVDTCSGEFSAETPYLYATYAEENESQSLGDQAVAVLGSGPNRIGQGIEFDYSCVKATQSLQAVGKQAIMINSNPETVSTDYDSSDKLYLSPLYEEDLFDILRFEKPEGLITSFSGQTGINLREKLEKGFRARLYQVPLWGTSFEAIETTEDRKQFADLVADIGLAKTKSLEVRGYQNLIDAIIEIGFPVIIRPSYVIGGESMFIFHGHNDIHSLPSMIKAELHTGQVKFLVETYLEGAFEYDVDLVRDKKGNMVFTASEHIEHAGVHSGDSGMITPPVHLTGTNYQKLKDIATQIATKLKVIGPLNLQFAIKDNQIYCIEANPRGSRTLPFLSKAYDLNLSDFVITAMQGGEIPNFDCEVMKHFCVKQSTFPFDRFPDDPTLLGPKMLSTGETMGIDRDKDQAILKSYLGNYPYLETPGKILLSLSDPTKSFILPYLKLLSKKGYQFVATQGTCHFVRKQGFVCEEVAKIGEAKGDVVESIKSQNYRMVFNTPLSKIKSQTDGEKIRQAAIAEHVPLFTRVESIKAVIESLIGSDNDMTPLSLQELEH